jgi:hypothetical protein
MHSTIVTAEEAASDARGDAALEPPETGRLLRGCGPRFLRDAFGPVLAFSLGTKLGGVKAGIALSTAVSLIEYRFERRYGRRGFIARLSLGFVLVNAAAGLISNSGSVFLALPVLQAAAFGVAFLASAAIGRPLTGLVAQEMRPMPPSVIASRTYRRVFGKSSIVWGICLLARSSLRMAVLATGSLGAFVLVNFVTGLPLSAALMAWSIRDGVRGFRKSDEWGPAISGLERRETDADLARDGTIAPANNGSER